MPAAPVALVPVDPVEVDPLVPVDDEPLDEELPMCALRRMYPPLVLPLADVPDVPVAVEPVALVPDVLPLAPLEPSARARQPVTVTVPVLLA